MRLDVSLSSRVSSQSLKTSAGVIDMARFVCDIAISENIDMFSFVIGAHSESVASTLSLDNISRAELISLREKIDRVLVAEDERKYARKFYKMKQKTRGSQEIKE